MRTVFVMGTTCAGKTTIINKACEMDSTVSKVQVGKLLRAKYGEAYFKGQGAPEHTQAEAKGIMAEEIEKCRVAGYRVCLVDGQPRTEDHAWQIIENCVVNCSFVLITADEDERLRRAREGRTGDSLALAEARVRGDYADLCKVLIELIGGGETPLVIDTTSVKDVGALASMLLRWP